MNKVNVIKQNLEFIGKTWIKCIGTFASILSLFFLFWTWDDIRITSTQYKCVIIILLCVLALILAILWTCIFKRTKTIWESPSGKIKVCYSDIMKDGFDKRNKEEKLFVIPVNSCFDTIVDEDISTCSKPWNKSGSIDFRFTNSHEKTYQVRDSSSKATLFNRLETRLSASKNFLLIISDKTNYDRGILNWEIEKAVDYYELPIIIAYPGYSKIGAPSELNSMWTKSLAERIKNARAHCIHIPFKKEPIFDAINQFSVVNSKYPKGGALGCYSEEAYKSWGIV